MHRDAIKGCRMLVVEDDASIRELLRDQLSLAGCVIDEAEDGREALHFARTATYQLIVLDLMLPSLDGISLCRTIRSQDTNRETPILMLTARDTEADKVLGLESGADDYLTKPFGVRELMARITAILRRSEMTGASEAGDQVTPIASPGISIDPYRREVTVRGNVIELTRQEFDLLYLLASRPGIVFSREALLTRVWLDDAFVNARTVDSVVSRIRRKLERDPQDPELVLTAWGVGYKFVDLN